jgi:predicted nucleotidyltransferase
MENLPIEIICNQLSQLEREYDVKILYAIESGSRAWGFASSDDDYDIRFIYAHTKEEYLSVFKKPDVIRPQIVDEYDYEGWDLKKALNPMSSRNLTIVEWLNSSIIYKKDDYFYATISELSKLCFYPQAGIYHYFSMAQKTYQQYFHDEYVPIKKYFYVLRSILSCMWIDEHQSAPPIEITALLTQITAEYLLNEINMLLNKKKSGTAFEYVQKIPVVDTFIKNALDNFEKKAKDYAINFLKEPRIDLSKEVDEAFLKILENNKKEKMDV